MTNTQARADYFCSNQLKPSKRPAGRGRKGEVSNQHLPAHPMCSTASSASPTCPEADRRLSPHCLLTLYPQLLPREPRRRQMMSPPPSLVCGKQPGGSPQALGVWSLLGTVPSPTPPPTEHRTTWTPVLLQGSLISDTVSPSSPGQPFRTVLPGNPCWSTCPHSGLSAQPLRWAEKRGLHPQIQHMSPTCTVRQSSSSNSGPLCAGVRCGAH